jgi:hypothetical protein
VIRPAPGELLRGIREALRESVLPALPAGAAQRQLKAALHALARLERSWDRYSTCLREDNADMRASGRAILQAAQNCGGAFDDLRAVFEAGLPAPLAEFAGIGDPELRQAAADNLQLQQALVALDERIRSLAPGADCPQPQALLAALYRRMALRERKASAVEAQDE